MYLSWQTRSLLLTAAWIVAAIASTVWAEAPRSDTEPAECHATLSPCTDVND